jgi:predicted esterase
MFFTTPPSPPQPPKQVVVWVHGTRPQELVLSQNLKHILTDLRLHLSFCPIGLHTLDELKQDNLHVYTVAQMLNEADPVLFAKDHVYLFGWSGKLNPGERKKAAHELHAALKSLRDKYIKQYGLCPPFMIITHSHGANVALNLAGIEDNDIVIDKLVLLAGPVQKETEPFVSSPLFKKVYSIHSHRDAFQVIDPQGLHGAKKAIKTAWKEKSWQAIKDAFNKDKRKKKLFSERHFPFYNNLIQANVEWKDKAPWTQEDLAVFRKSAKTIEKFAKLDISHRGLMHVEFLLPTFIKKLPYMINYLSNCSPIRSDINPDITIQL